MGRLATVVIACVALGVTGCSTFKLDRTPTTPFLAKVCVSGAVPVACAQVGPIDVPEGGIASANLALAIVAPFLERRANLKTCALNTYPPVIEHGAITVTATAVCKLNGLPVQEDVTLTLTPASTSPPQT